MEAGIKPEMNVKNMLIAIKISAWIGFSIATVLIALVKWFTIKLIGMVKR